MTTRPLSIAAMVLALFWVGLSVGPVGADDDSQEPRLASFQLYWENDTFLPTEGTDEYYTNGIKFAWTRNPNRQPVPRWAVRFLDGWCGRSGLCPDADFEHGYGHALGQNLYTPDSIVDPNPQPDDRPWAAYLYFSWIASVTHRPSDRQDVQNLFELQVGLVGPGAGGRFVQTEVHKIVDSPKPLGWSHQLENEPTVNLNYLWRKRIGNETLDVVPSLGFGLGNVASFGSAGATVRLGYQMASFPQTLITPANSDGGEIGPQEWEAYVFVGGEGRAVAHNIFLDGNVFVDGPRIEIDPKPFVFDFKAGVAVRYKAWRLDYTWVNRSEEFEPPAGRPDGDHRFGAVAISWQLWRNPSE